MRSTFTRGIDSISADDVRRFLADPSTYARPPASLRDQLINGYQVASPIENWRL